MNSMIGYWTRRNRIIYCSTNVLIMRIPSEKWTKKCISRKNEVNNKNVETLFLQVSVTNEDNRLEKRKCSRPWDKVDNFILQQPNWSKLLTHKDFINHDATMRLQIRDIIIFCQIQSIIHRSLRSILYHVPLSIWTFFWHKFYIYFYFTFRIYIYLAALKLLFILHIIAQLPKFLTLFPTVWSDAKN